MRKYVITGVPGSGKSTQATMLARDLDLVQISVGDIFRWHVRQHTKIGAHVRRTMAAGKLVDDDLVESIVRERLQLHDWNYGFIIDGFPRSRDQAEFFLESYDIDAVIDLRLPEEEVRRRVLARRICTGCGRDYNLVTEPPATENSCDACGGELVTRADDTEAALTTRLREYHEKTAPVLEIFRRKTPVVAIDTRPDEITVQQEIRARLGLPDYPDRAGSVRRNRA
ncbi:nucleoside monophosphate kinase [Planosporangium thailandense]|uniref:Adenylate kinase n=1 Tax=Planosporangium thailandense TaxID=765197 RepID=A0ABX0XVP0_9ACTN|nr:nucleoside monophosphate kinase [Planosporangium thailandense]NJC70109.1 nucleoside monophosphate kinase [Planosporangium thailandense]